MSALHMKTFWRMFVRPKKRVFQNCGHVIWSFRIFLLPTANLNDTRTHLRGILRNRNFVYQLKYGDYRDDPPMTSWRLHMVDRHPRPCLDWPWFDNGTYVYTAFSDSLYDTKVTSVIFPQIISFVLRFTKSCSGVIRHSSSATCLAASWWHHQCNKPRCMGQ